MNEVPLKQSVNGKIWQPKQVDNYYAQELCQKLGISDFVARLLASRAGNVTEAYDFLTPKIKSLLPDPSHLLDMEKAVERTINAILNKEQIFIFADYDVDGATSSALLRNIFRDLGVHVNIYVPDRILEGYGPSKEGMQKIKDAGGELVITVDCGAMAHEPIRYAKEIGLDVIVIDHHIGGASLPEAVAIVNPNRLDETSQYKYLAAVGVAFLFATALVGNLRKIDYFSSKETPKDTEDNSGSDRKTRDDLRSVHIVREHKAAPLSDAAIPELPKVAPNLLQYLDLVALGTVCDVMPITGLNRAFVAQGLKVMQQKQNIGIRSLLDIALVEDKIGCYHLGYVLGPRINAGGRVGKSSLGAHLLSTLCHIEAKDFAFELDQYNTERKVIELTMLEEAEYIAMQQLDKSCIFVAKEGWHPGVIGIIAGRIKEKYDKPVAVVALNDGIGKASCRSIKGIDFGSRVLEAKYNELLIAGGGHAMAAGFTVAQDKLSELENFLNVAFENDFAKLSGHNICEYEIDLTSSSINLDLMHEISRLEPYGVGNPEPIVKLCGLFVLKAEVLATKHIKCLLAPDRNSYGSKAITAMAFNAVGGNLQDILFNKRPINFDVIGSLKINRWQGRESVQLYIKDLIVNF